MYAVIFMEDEVGEIKCGICERKIDHGWAIVPQSLEEEEFLGKQFPNYNCMSFCDIHLEILKKECETNGFSIKINKDPESIPDWVIDPYYLPDGLDDELE